MAQASKKLELSPHERFIIDETALYGYQCRFGENIRATLNEQKKENPDKDVLERLSKERRELAIEEKKIYSDDMQYKIDYIRKHGKNPNWDYK